jgi:hypothetical protein
LHIVLFVLNEMSIGFSLMTESRCPRRLLDDAV